MAKRLVNGVWVEEPDDEDLGSKFNKKSIDVAETKATEPSVQETEVDANVEEGSQQDGGEGTTGGWVLPQFRLENFGLDNTTGDTLIGKRNLSPIQGDNAIENAERLGVVPTMEQVKENAAKAEVAQAQEGLSELERKAEESQRLADDAFANYVSMLNQQAEESKPQYTEEELQRYSRANTGFASMLSAIANVANVGNVAKGGYAAVVPDGYKVAKAQWDQIKKDERARKRYYDQLKAQISNYEYTRVQAKYKKFTDQLNAEQKHLWDMELQKAKSEADLKKMEAEWGYKFTLAEMNAIIKQNEYRAKHEYEMEEKKYDRGTKISVENIKASNSSSNSGSGSNYDIEELRSMTYGPTTYTVPNGTDISEAYSNKVFPFIKERLNDRMVDINDEIRAISTRGSESYMTNDANRNKRITELRNERSALERKMSKISKIGHGSDAKGRYNAVKDISQYLGELGVTEEEWNGLFGGSGSGDATDRLAN